MSFLLSALLLVRIGNRLQSDAPARIGRDHWRDVRVRASRSFATTRYLSSIFLIWSWATLAYTGINVAEIVLAKSQYQATEPARSASGSSSQPPLSARSSEPSSPSRLHRPPWRLRRPIAPRSSSPPPASSICAVSPGLAIGCVGAVIYGVGNGVGLVCNVTLIQQVVPDARRGQIFAVLGSLVQTFTLLGLLAAGPVTDAIGPRLTWGVSAGLLDRSATSTPSSSRRCARGARSAQVRAPSLATCRRRQHPRAANGKRASAARAGRLAPGRDRPDARGRGRTRLRHAQQEALLRRQR